MSRHVNVKVNGVRMFFSVVTPATRSWHLERLFASLQAQTLQDFEWIIIDDGGHDDIADVVQRLQEDAQFRLVFRQQQHGFKASAVNRAATLAEGLLMVVIDDDDELLPKALESTRDAWLSIPEDERGDYFGVTGLCVDESNRIVGFPFPTDPLDCTFQEAYVTEAGPWEHLISGRVDVFKQYPFPGNLSIHIPESVVWRRIGRDGYLMRHTNTPMRRYYDSSDGIMANMNTLRSNADGRFIAACGLLRDWQPDHGIRRLGAALARATVFLVLAGRDSDIEQYDRVRAEGLKDLRGRPFWLLVVSVAGVFGRLSCTRGKSETSRGIGRNPRQQGGESPVGLSPKKP